MNLPDGRSKKRFNQRARFYHCMDENDVKRVLKYKLTMIRFQTVLPNTTRIHTQDCGNFPESARSLLPRRKTVLVARSDSQDDRNVGSAFNSGPGRDRCGAFADLVFEADPEEY